MILSYVSRQNWLQHNQAVHVINVYAEAMSGGKGKTNSRNGYARASAPPRGNNVSGGDLLSMMGQRTVMES